MKLDTAAFKEELKKADKHTGPLLSTNLTHKHTHITAYITVGWSYFPSAIYP